MFLYEVVLQYERDVIRTWHIHAESSLDARLKAMHNIFRDFVQFHREEYPTQVEPNWDDFIDNWDVNKHSIQTTSVI